METRRRLIYSREFLILQLVTLESVAGFFHLMDEMIETFVSPEDAEILNQVKARGIKTVEDFEDLAGPAFFISIPSPLLMRSDVTPEAKIIYAMIVGLTRVKGHCNPTNEYLSKISALSIRAIRLALTCLGKAGLISLKIERNESGTWRYLTPLTSESLYAHFPGLIGEGGDRIDRRGVSKMATHNNKEVKNKETHSKPDGLVVDKSVSKNNGISLRGLVLVWKEVSGVAAGDAAWDKIHFPRCAKAAKSLLEVFGQDEERAGRCIKEVHRELTAKNLGVTLETVVKKAHEWRQRNQPRPQETNESKLMRRICLTCRGGRIEPCDNEMRCTSCNHDYTDQLAKVTLRVA